MAERREAKVASIVDAAWALARTEGIGGVALHALAREIGIRQPSLYAYFDSKNALFDAMFADGNRRWVRHLDRLIDLYLDDANQRRIVGGRLRPCATCRSRSGRPSAGRG